MYATLTGPHTRGIHCIRNAFVIIKLLNRFTGQFQASSVLLAKQSAVMSPLRPHSSPTASPVTKTFTQGQHTIDRHLTFSVEVNRSLDNGRAFVEAAVGGLSLIHI